MRRGGAPSGLMRAGLRRRRRRAVSTVVVAAVAVVATAYLVNGETSRHREGQAGAADDTSVVSGEASVEPDDGGEAPATAADPAGSSERDVVGEPEVADPTTPPLARLDDLQLWSPAAAPIIVGYHEAATVSAIGVTPIGRLTEDRNTTRTDLPADAAVGGPYLVLTSRGRAAGPTSAVDVVLEPGVAVLAPVTGRVADVRSYLLYGTHQDLRIELVPDDRPDVRLVLIHLDGAEVAIGDRVTGGVTPIARTARLFPFSSHIDRETEPDRYPHVHMELQPVDAPRPGDPVTDGAADGELP